MKRKNEILIDDNELHFSSRVEGERKDHSKTFLKKVTRLLAATGLSANIELTPRQKQLLDSFTGPRTLVNYWSENKESLLKMTQKKVYLSNEVISMARTIVKVVMSPDYRTPLSYEENKHLIFAVDLINTILTKANVVLTSEEMQKTFEDFSDFVNATTEEDYFEGPKKKKKGMQTLAAKVSRFLSKLNPFS